jgi:hypothetical protein
VTSENNAAANNNAIRPGYKSRQAEARERRKGHLTRRCKAVGLDGPCKNFTQFEFCHMHEWQTTQLVSSASQRFVLMLPLIVQRLRQAIQDADHETAIRGILTWHKLNGEKPIGEGLSPFNKLEDLTAEQLIERAQRAIAALQAPLSGAPPDGLETAQDAPETANGTQPGGNTGAGRQGSETVEIPRDGKGLDVCT